MRLLVQQCHAQVAAGVAFALCDVFEPSRHEREGGVPVWRDAHDSRPESNLPVQVLDYVVSVNVSLVLAGDPVDHETRFFPLKVDFWRRPDCRGRHRSRHAPR